MADDKNPQNPAAKTVNDKAQMPAKNAPTFEYKLEVDASGEEKIVTGNMTRDAIISFQRGKFMEQGKAADEALELAVKRGYEMIKDATEKK